MIRFYDALRERSLGIPGVGEVAWTTRTPLSRSRSSSAATTDDRQEITIEGQGIADQERNPYFLQEVVSHRYFDVLGIPVLEGRTFLSTDRRGSPPAALVNRKAALRFWPGASPVGKRLKFGRPDAEGEWLTVVGVVDDVRHDASESKVEPVLYTATRQQPQANLFVLVKAAGEGPSAGQFARAAQAVDADQSVYSVSTLRDLREGQLWQQRLTLRLFALFAASALVLALVGMYGLVTLWVREREREYGIRSALGATPAMLSTSLLREAVGLVLRGGFLAVPLCAAFILVLRGIVALVPRDLALFAVAALGAMLVILVAGVPSLVRVARTWPASALR